MINNNVTLKVTRYITEENQAVKTYEKNNFSLTKEETAHIVFPEGNITSRVIVASINEALNLENKKFLSVKMFHDVLKSKELLSKTTHEKVNRTITTNNSHKYGIITVKNIFQGEEYERILYTDAAKEFILNNLLFWFSAS